HRLEFINYATLVTATDNDAYNTLVARNLAPNIVVITSFISCEKSLVVSANTPHTLGGQKFCSDAPHDTLEKMVDDGWTFRGVRLTAEFGFDDRRMDHKDSVLMGGMPDSGPINLVRFDTDIKSAPDVRLSAMRPPSDRGAAQPTADLHSD
ncbi:MAG: hypothetical protein OSA94_11875, partial [Yoonia sp.]|nr:hypothetical protein [Yoonia sp.]